MRVKDQREQTLFLLTLLVIPRKGRQIHSHNPYAGAWGFVSCRDRSKHLFIAETYSCVFSLFIGITIKEMLQREGKIPTALKLLLLTWRWEKI